MVFGDYLKKEDFIFLHQLLTQQILQRLNISLMPILVWVMVLQHPLVLPELL